MLPFSADHYIKERFEAGHSNLCVLVHECGEECSPHHFAEVNQILVSADGKLLHDLATFNNDLAGRVHA